MDIFSILLIAVALAMDAFAVSISNGILIKNLKLSHALIFGLFFGGFQFIMPILGYFGGKTFNNYIVSFDHYIAFFLLAIIGGKMIYETFKDDEEKNVREDKDIMSISNLSFMAIATSIDAMAVGVSFAMIGVNILFASIIIGIVAFVFSASGVLIGKKISHLFKTSAERIGGLILIIIGVKILIEHLSGKA